MDVLRPDGAGPFPVVIAVHGGSWTSGGRRTGLSPLLDICAAIGWAALPIDYRLAPANRFPAAVDDVDAAVTFVRDNALRLRIDPRRIVLAGASAGGHLASYAVARHSNLGVGGVLVFSGPQDLIGLASWLQGLHVIPPELQALLGIRRWNRDALRKLRDASPLTHVHSGMPPFLFVHGAADTLVPPEQSTAMCDALRSAGNACSAILVPGAGHEPATWPESGEWRAAVTRWLQSR